MAPRYRLEALFSFAEDWLQAAPGRELDALNSKLLARHRVTLSRDADGITRALRLGLHYYRSAAEMLDDRSARMAEFDGADNPSKAIRTARLIVKTARIVTELQEALVSSTAYKQGREDDALRSTVVRLSGEVEKLAAHRDADWQVWYNVACFYARQASSRQSITTEGPRSKAIRHLRRALESTPSDRFRSLVEWMRSDPDLDWVRDDPMFGVESEAPPPTGGGIAQLIAELIDAFAPRKSTD